MSRILFLMLMLSNSWSSSRLSNVLSEFGDFLIVIPILAFLLPSSLLLLLQLELLRLSKTTLRRLKITKMFLLSFLSIVIFLFPGANTWVTRFAFLFWLSWSNKSLPEIVSGFLMDFF